MSLANTGVFQVDNSAGDDVNNAGYFNPSRAGAGTDFSLTSPLAFSDLAVDATTNTKVSSSLIGLGSAHFGNGIRIVSGAGFTPGLYEVLSVSGGIATLDRSPAAVGTTGGTGRIGGALASMGQVGALQAGGLCYLRATLSPYVFSNTSNVAGGKLVAGGGSLIVIGYTTNRTPTNTDTRPVIQPGANSVTCFDANISNSCGLINIDFQNPSAFTGAVGFYFNIAGGHYLANVRSVGLTGSALQAGTSSLVVACEVSGGAASSSVAGGIVTGNNGLVAYSTCRDGGGFGSNTTASSPVTAIGCAAHNITTANSGSGGAFSGFNRLFSCVAHTVAGTVGGGNGFLLSPANAGTPRAINCVAIGCANFGFTGTAAAALSLLRNCAGFNNTAGNVNSTIFPTAQQLNFLALAGDPFLNAGALNFGLNTGVGALLRAAGYPATLPGFSGTSYPDIGAYQHADPAASGGAVSIGSGGY